MIGYSSVGRRYRILTNRVNGAIRETAHVVFAERIIPTTQEQMVFGDESDLELAPFFPVEGESNDEDEQLDDNVSSHTDADDELVSIDDNNVDNNVDIELHHIVTDNDNINIDNIDDTDTNTDNATYDVMPRRSTRTTVPINRYSPTVRLLMNRYTPTTRSLLDRYIPSIKSLTINNNKLMTDKEFNKLLIDEMVDYKHLPPSDKVYPTSKINFKEAIKDPRLIESMRKELKSLFDVGCFRIVDLPHGRHAIGNVWVHKFKNGPDGEFIRIKSRVCPWGFQQKPDEDYNVDEVSSPTLHLESGFKLLCITVQRNMFSILLDVDGAFQLPINKQDVYMKYPDGMKRTPGKVLKLDHSMNGTKQSAFNWHELADKLLFEIGFKPTVTDACLYYRYVKDKLCLVGLYVDDFRCAADDENHLADIVKHFKSKYSIKEQPADWWLGLKVDHDRVKGTLKISQEQQIRKVLEQFNMSDCKPASTPAEPNSKLIKSVDGEKDYDAAKFPYREAIGALLWIARTCRPDILYAVNKLGSHCNNPNTSHVTAAKRVFRYLQGTPTLGITYRRADNLVLEAMSDADWAGEPQENEKPMRSTNGIIIYLKGIGPINWVSSLQTTISQSTAEAEYKCIGAADKLVMGERNLLSELKFPQLKPTTIYEDNDACIAMAKANFTSSKMRHLQINHHYIKEIVASKNVLPVYCSTENMVADIMTKALPKAAFVKLRYILLNGL